MARAGGRERGADDEFASNFSTASLSLSFHYSPCTASHSFGSWMNCDWRRLRVNKALVQGVSSSSHAAAGGGREGGGRLRKCLNRRINWLIEAIIRLLFFVVVSRPWISIYWSTFHIQFPWQMKWICATCALWMDLQMRLQIDFTDLGGYYGLGMTQLPVHHEWTSNRAGGANKHQQTTTTTNCKFNTCQISLPHSLSDSSQLLPMLLQLHSVHLSSCLRFNNIFTILRNVQRPWNFYCGESPQ